VRAERDTLVRKNFSGGALATLNCAVDGADVADAGGLAGKEQFVFQRLCEDPLMLQSVYRNIGVRASGKRIVAPVVTICSFQLRLDLLAGQIENRSE
jgi:hypothetical protein